MFKLKKGKDDFFCCGCYGRFLSNKIASKAPTMAIATIMPATAGTKYMSATDCGAGVAFLEDMIKWLENYVLARKSSMGSHFAKVEKRIDEISTLSLDDCKKGLQVRVDAWGRRPFEEYIHEKGVYE